MIYSTYIKEEAPAPEKGIRLAIAQCQGQVGSKNAVKYNLGLIEERAKRAKEHGAHIVSFSEMFLTGYTLYKDDIPDLVEPIDGPSMKKVAEIAKKYSIAIICPYPEKATVRGENKHYDSMAIFDKDGSLLKNYRKAHLWGPEEKKKWDSGHMFPEEGTAYDVFKVNGFPMGVVNCYEGEFPELTRILALKGAKLVVIPTAADIWEWVDFPKRDENGDFIYGTGESKTPKPYPDVSRNVIPVHAQENTIFVAYSNAWGIEMDGKNPMMEFLGNSVVANPCGEVMVAARNEDTLLIADCIPTDYKSIHPRESAYIANRRPDLYKVLVEKVVD